VCAILGIWGKPNMTLRLTIHNENKLTRRMGKKKALVAVGHSILVIAYHILKNRASYHELGGDYFDRQNVESQRARYIKRLEALGLKVSVKVASEAA
jgi:hypothetical protein